MKSCSGCSIDEASDQLTCTKCTKNCGAQVLAATTFSACESKAWGNDGGALVCEDVPPGPYLRTCDECSQSDGMLACKCFKSDGSSVSASKKVEDCKHVGRFDNKDGQLVCDENAPAETRNEDATQKREL